jgi:hypothetical protein
MEWHGEKVLVSESFLGRLYVYFEEYKGRNFLHLRYWVQNKRDGGDFKPGMKGIAIPEEKVKTILEAVKLVLKREAAPAQTLQQELKDVAPTEQDAVSAYGG